jgi:nucleotide-binding universal stress UspA family protein
MSTPSRELHTAMAALANIERTVGAKIRPIMVPLDGSPLAERALPWAIALAAARCAPLLLARVVEPIVYPSEISSYSMSMQEWMVESDERPAHDYLDGKARAVRLAHPDLTVTTEVLLGHPAMCLQETEQRHDVQLVVMTSHGRTGIERWVRGSVAEKMLRFGTAPVFLVRPRDDAGRAAALAKGARVLVPLDGSELAAHAIPEAIRLATGTDGAIVLAVVLDPMRQPSFGQPDTWRATVRESAYEYLNAIAREVKAQGVGVNCVVLTAEDIAGAIVDQAILESADLIVMSTHGRGSLGRWIYGSVADRVAQAARVPVLLVHPPAAADPREHVPATAATENTDFDAAAPGWEVVHPTDAPEDATAKPLATR